MMNYEEAYLSLFNAVTDVISLLKSEHEKNAVAKATFLLQKAQQNTEQAYISAEEE